jgi:hypothetical protein
MQALDRSYCVVCCLLRHGLVLSRLLWRSWVVRLLTMSTYCVCRTGVWRLLLA